MWDENLYISGRRTSHFGFYKLGNFLYKWARELGNPWGTEKLGGEFRILILLKNCILVGEWRSGPPQFFFNFLTICSKWVDKQ